MYKYLLLALSLSMGSISTLYAEKEATLEDQLPPKTAGDSFLANKTQAIFFPGRYKQDKWPDSPMWVKKPEAKYNLPENWKTKVRFDNQFGKARAIIPIPEGTDLYGSGLTMGTMRRNNTKVGLWCTDNYGYGTDGGRRLYETHPWIMGVRPDGSTFGVIADTTWKGSLETNDKEIIFEADGPVFPVVVIEGKDPQDVITQLTERIGRIEMPPLWTLGYQQCRWSYEPDKRGLEVVKTFRDKKIPADVIWMDIDYMDGYRVFTFSDKNFPDPKAYSDALHDMNFKGVWMIDPGVKNDENYFVLKSGNENDVWVKDNTHKEDFVGNVWPGPCKFPDFTRKETRAWWANLYHDFMNKNGLDGIWNDMNEPAVFSHPGHTMPEDNHHRGDDMLPPGPHIKYHNIYGLLMMQASHDGMKAAQPDKRPFLLSRSNFLGGHRYGATWTGDNVSSEDHMKLSIPHCLNMGMSGQAFIGPDLGGFGGTLTPELMQEWVSFGAFYPFCRGHAAKGTNDKEFWALGQETEDVARLALERRYKLLPYYYTLFEEATRNGMPVMRPVFFADTTDKGLRDEQEAFLIGQDLLVIPTFAKEAKLPKGDWVTIALYEDSKDKVAKQATLKLRPGAILPVGQTVQHTGEDMLGTTTLIINLDDKGTATGTLYEDAGNGYGYKDGDFCRTVYTAETKDNNVTVTAKQSEGKRPTSTKKLVVRLQTKNGEIKAEGTPDKPITLKLN